MAKTDDTTIKKVSSKYSPRGRSGQKYLVSGVGLAMRLWEEEKAGEPKQEASRDYETVGYVIEGKAELHLSGQRVTLEKGDSWLVPAGAPHRYEILEPFTAVEATHPPAHIEARDR